ncbi:DHA2 family efflux MFS transporter permease subunit [Rhodopila sp.]|jgi:DHA2 family multidrug resistance protein|uniref:DHA2 family efflux MFS transporter permease subunit n=1 Tax=Rhodopila sp. TaxID=2480087 RepID=UPI002CCD3890|nr:DHA2 family efflux MFS transporter permease subunit [Rhodopila sp.]HVZ10351.1 DHA2 family efflux MFS transporter permease subunit [Rhodopila sp.]
MEEGTRVPNRGLVTAAAMIAMLMQTLDSTIANVALPYMQGSMSASSDEIDWVLTSYVIAAAIMTAPVGWMARRFGRKRLFIGCLIGFTIASMLCGAAQSLEQLVGFRLLQGMCGAAIAPLSQATMLDIYPFSRRAQAMAIFSMGVTMGPIMGPTLGGWLTDAYSWRYVFYVNLPLGVLSVAGLALFMQETPAQTQLRFSWYGFAMLAIACGSFQLMLDRGQELDWFTSREILVEAVVAGLALYLFVVHMLTADRPFFSPGLFRDANFSSGMVMVFCVSSVLLSTSALLAPYLQNLAGYPVLTAGWAMAPRGLGTILSMYVASRLGMRVDQRKIMAVGLLVLAAALYDMSTWTPDVPQSHMAVTLIVQGFSIGLVFNPMSVMAYTTLAPHLRGEGTAMQSLARNFGSAVGISVTSFTLTRNVQATHADIAAGITPFNRVLQMGNEVSHLLDPLTKHGAALLNGMIDQQAAIIAYNNDFRLMMLSVVPPLLLLLVMRRHRQPEAGE